MADRKSWREEKPRSRRHEDREREGSLLFSSPLKPITIHAPACFNSFAERKQRIGRLRPRKGCARLIGQESARLDLQKPTGAITRDELQKALLNQGVQRRRDETDDCTKLSDMQKLERIGCYRIDYSDETARGDQSGSGNYDGKTLRKGHPNSGLRALAKDGCRRNRSRAFESLPSIEQDGYYGGMGICSAGGSRRDCARRILSAPIIRRKFKHPVGPGGRPPLSLSTFSMRELRAWPGKQIAR